MGWRRWVFPLVAACLPLVAVAVSEIALSAAGVGYPTSFFVPASRPQATYITNPRFGWRFFPRPLARTPIVTAVSSPKAPRTFRIFVFGESAAMGTPDPAFSFARILETMIAEAFPDVTVEVINTAMTAINSHVIRLIVGEAGRFEPDLYLFYMGNNEVVGPYGPATVFGRAGAALPLVRADLWLRGTRTGQLLAEVLGWMRSGTPPRFEWRGLEMFAEHRLRADDPRLAVVYDHFQRNLADMADAAERARVPVVLATVATNLADNPPFASLPRPGMRGAERRRWQQLVEQGGRDLAAGRAAEALDALSEALRLDDHPADLQFQLGRAYLAIGRREAALRAFTRARDRDALRFRADSRINDLIRAAAGRRGVELVDFERALVDELGGPPGAPVFWDHVHLTFEGNYRLARSLFPVVARYIERARQVARRREALSLEECAERLAYTDWDRARVATAAYELTRRPPFTGQLNHADRVARLRAEAREWQRRARAALELVERQYRRALARRPGDWLLRANFAALLRERGRFAEASAEWRRLVEAAPMVAEWRAQLAFALADEAGARQPPDRTLQAEAREILEALAREEPELPGAQLNLGNVLRQMGDRDGALARYRAALHLNPGYELARLNLAALLAEGGQVDEAVSLLREGLTLDPEAIDLRESLAGLLDRRGNVDEALAEYRRVLAAEPERARARNNLAYLLERKGRLDEALAEYRRAVASDPEYALAHLNLGDLLLRRGRLAEAVVSWRAAVALAPDHVGALVNLAWVLATAADGRGRRPLEAVQLAERAAGLAPGAPEVWRTLAAAYWAAGRHGQAVEAATRALELARARPDPQLAARIEAELHTYRR